MDCLWIEGGKRLSGTLEVPSSKNAALPLMCLSLMTSAPVSLEALPAVADIESMRALLKDLGAEEAAPGQFQTKNIRSIRADYEIVRKMRASILVLGPLLAREGRAEVSLPGGCNIGDRPIDIHLEGLREMGAKIEIEGGYIFASASRLKGCHFSLPFPTVTGSINLMMAASLAEGVSHFENMAQEPEVTEVAHALKAMGAKIEGEGTAQLRIEGVSQLSGLNWRVPPDRIQLLTYLAAAAITGGEIRCRPYDQSSLGAVIQKFKDMSCQVEERREEMLSRVGNLHSTHSQLWQGAKAREYLEVSLSADSLKATDIETAPFPGFPTDAQAQFMACLSIADGSSQIHETVFENRFQHVSELKRMGAQIKLNAAVATIKGVKGLSGASVMASDLRASASLVLAGLAAKGKTQVLRVYHLDRGYENIEENLQGLGARIWRAPQ
ncbi:MAG: UDP-N-acetylglucosamine 1-carboxyvinyltransferase [Bradymonadales bacterium]|nr:MAG: UDP-N-acetylglucosamine 1-carboxyvinyltransferase [Bradymonadales bacterium]